MNQDHIIQARQNAVSQPNQQPTPQKQVSKSPRFDLEKVFHFALMVASAILLLGLALMLNDSKSKPEALRQTIDPERYQAIYLDTSNSQVYFGRLGVSDLGHFVLTDIYYVNVTQVTDADGKTANDVRLAKWGSELHGPSDWMNINPDKVLFWGNLENDGQVVCAIRDYQINTLDLDVTKDENCPEPAAAATSNQTDSTTAAETSDTTANDTASDTSTEQ